MKETGTFQEVSTRGVPSAASYHHVYRSVVLVFADGKARTFGKLATPAPGGPRIAFADDSQLGEFSEQPTASLQKNKDKEATTLCFFVSDFLLNSIPVHKKINDERILFFFLLLALLGRWGGERVAARRRARRKRSG